MSKYFNNFDPEKAVEIILYIAENAPIPDIYHITKILYFADKIHLQKYGRFVSGDSYVAMKNGPVPSSTYDIIKYVRGDGYLLQIDHASKSFNVKPKPDNRIILLRETRLDLFSDSDIECLNEAIKKYGSLPFEALKKKSHDGAFKNADMNDFMSIEDIASTLEDSELIIQNLNEF